MATFTGTNSADTANAATGTLTGFTGGTVAELQDAIGDTFLGRGGIDTIFAGGGNDTIQGGLGTDTINGFAGDDTIQVRQGEFGDNVDGSAGTDLLDLTAFTTQTATVDLGGGTWSTSLNGGLTIARVEHVFGGGGGDDITGNNLNNTLKGGGGSDQLSGGGSVDTLEGNDGNDALRGGGGIDTVDGGAGNDVIVVLQNELGDHVDGGTGVDGLDLAFTTQTATVDLAAGTWDTSLSDSGLTVTGVENVFGGAGNDAIAGSSGVNTLGGRDGNDTLRGGGGIDTVGGGDGNDAFRVLQGELGDYIDGGADRDHLDLAGLVSDTAIVDLAAGAWSTSAGGGNLSIIDVEDVTGGKANDRIAGDDRANSLNGSAGADIVSGGNGNDGVQGAHGDDRLFGGAGGDTMNGGAGSDLLHGGAGGDLFRFSIAAHSAVGAARDAVRDFIQGADRVDLSRIDANLGIAGNQAFDSIGSGGFSGVAGELRFTQTATQTILAMDVDGDRAADSQIAFVGVIDFEDGDFLL